MTTKLSAFAVAAEHIQEGKGRFHLVVLNTQRRTLSVKPYSEGRLDEANAEYAAVEARTKAGEPIEAVLVSAGPIESLRKAYPNYFLDTQEFTSQVHNDGSRWKATQAICPASKPGRAPLRLASNCVRCSCMSSC